MTLASIGFLGLIMFGVVTHAAASAIQDKIDISVYFNTNTSEDEILNIQQSLEGLSQVASVDYISRDQALATFQQNHANDPTVSQAINELDTNPLEASLNIKAKDPSQYGAINDYLSSPESCFIYRYHQLHAKPGRDQPPGGDRARRLDRRMDRHDFPRAHRGTRDVQYDPPRHLFQSRRDRRDARGGRVEQPRARPVRGGRNAMGTHSRGHQS